MEPSGVGRRASTKPRATFSDPQAWFGIRLWARQAMNPNLRSARPLPPRSFELHARSFFLPFALVATAAVTAQEVPQLVADINTQTSSGGTFFGAPTGGARLDGYTYFAANDPLHGTEPWRTDGTAAGTVLFKDIYPGNGGSNPANFVRSFGSVDGRVLFTANDGSSGT
jgi:ELWxxDGT repeat protein